MDHPNRPTRQSTLQLWCIMSALDDTTHRDSFPIFIDGNANVHDLKVAIRQNDMSTLGYLDADALILFDISDLSLKISKLCDKYPRNVDFNCREQLEPMQKLSTIFPSTAELRLRVIIRTEQLTLMLEDDGGRLCIPGLNQRLDKTVNSILNAASLPKSTDVLSVLKAHCIHDGRTGDVGPPVKLFHPVFGHFSDYLEDGSPVPAEFSRQVIAFSKAPSAPHLLKVAHHADLKRHLIRIIGFRTYRPQDGIVDHMTRLGSAVPVLMEFEGDKTDPSTEAGLSIARIWAQNNYDRIRGLTCCPTFLVAIAGGWMSILGAVLTDTVLVQRLTDFIWVGVDSVQPALHFTCLDKTFYAVESIQNLRDYYEGLRPIDRTPYNARYFPSITAYHENGQTIHFEYVGYLKQEISCCTLRGRTCTEPPMDIVVKFAQRYGETAHRLLADAGLAPRLLYCGSPRLKDEQPSYQNIMMVVMEYVITGKTIFIAKNAVDGAKVEDDVRRAIRMLHDNDIVFRDLRPPHVVITKAGQVKLVDFSWAGVHEQDRCPFLMPPEIARPIGVGCREILKKDHDLAMLDRLFCG